MKLIFYEAFTIFRSQTVWVCFLGLFWVHATNHSFPFEDGVTFCSISIDKNHDTTLSTLHIPKYIFEVWHILMFIEQIGDFLFE